MRAQTYVLLALIALVLGGCSALNHFGEFREGMDAGPRPDAGRDAYAPDAFADDAPVAEDAPMAADAPVASDAPAASDAAASPDAFAPDANTDAR